MCVIEIEIRFLFQFTFGRRKTINRLINGLNILKSVKSVSLIIFNNLQYIHIKFL